MAVTKNQYEAWTADEDALLTTHYYGRGAAPCRVLLPDRSRVAIRRRAYILGLITHTPANKRERSDATWPLPAQDLLEALDCVRLRNWRGPVTHGALRASLGVVLPLVTAPPGLRAESANALPPRSNDHPSAVSQPPRKTGCPLVAFTATQLASWPLVTAR